MPFSVEVERALVGRMLRDPRAVSELLGRYVERDDFATAECRLLFERIVEAYMADGHVDPIVIGERSRKPLAEIWAVPESEASRSLRALAEATTALAPLDAHVEQLKLLSSRRRVITAAERALAAAQSSESDPVAVSMELADVLTEVATGGRKKSGLMTRRESVESYVRELRNRVAIRQAGGELGVVTGFEFFDDRVNGLQPGEVFMLGGEPGVGKSALAQTLARSFAHRQLEKATEHRIGTLAINLEMTHYVDMGRDAQMLSGIDGDRLRQADVTEDEFRQLAKAYIADRYKELPLIANYASRLTASGVRAIILDALNRGYNTGFVIIDHFRMFDLDKGTLPKDAGSNQVDEEKARFLKELAKDLNIAIMCLAHTVKMDRMSDGRPTLADLRGSYQVAAYCDIVAFAYQPWAYASPTEREHAEVLESDAELIFAKNRNGRKGSTYFTFFGERMHVEDRQFIPI